MTDIAGQTDLGDAAALQADGKIVVVGRAARDGGSNPDVGIVRYTVAGVPDTTFGTGGVVRKDLSGDWDEATDVAIQPDGKIVVAVEALVGSSFAFEVARFGTDGLPDTSFGTAGIATTAFSVKNDYAVAGAPVRRKIVVAGGVSNLETPDFGVARFDAGGALDTTFHTTGRVTVDFFSSSDDAAAVAIQPDGKIVLAGSARNGGTTGLAIARVLP